MPAEPPTAPPTPGAPRRPRRWVAALLSLVSPGLGHLYAGRWRLAIALGLLWLATSVPFALAMRAGFVALVACAGLYAAAFLGIVGHAVRTAGAAPERSGGRGRRALLLAAFAVAASAAGSGMSALVRSRIAHPIQVSSASMAPGLEVGDLVVVVPGEGVERGAVVLHALRDGVLVRRIAALGGDTVGLENGALVLAGRPVERGPAGGAGVADRAADDTWQMALALQFAERNGAHAYRTLCTPERACGDLPVTAVPPGRVFVLTDRRDHAEDSRVYGPVPEGSVLGRVRYVYWSYGPGGVRWERLGRAIE